MGTRQQQEAQGVVVSPKPEQDDKSQDAIDKDFFERACKASEKFAEENIEMFQNLPEEMHPVADDPLFTRDGLKKFWLKSIMQEYDEIKERKSGKVMGK